MLVLSMSLFLIGCETNRVIDALAGAKITEEAGKQLDDQIVIADRRVKEALKLPPYPKSCVKTVNSNVVLNDRLDIAANKIDIALLAANNTIRRCAAYYNNLRNERNNLIEGNKK